MCVFCFPTEFSNLPLTSKLLCFSYVSQNINPIDVKKIFSERGKKNTPFWRDSQHLHDTFSIVLPRIVHFVRYSTINLVFAMHLAKVCLVCGNDKNLKKVDFSTAFFSTHSLNSSSVFTYCTNV